MEKGKRLSVICFLLLAVPTTFMLAFGLAAAQESDPRGNINGSSAEEEASAVSNIIPIQGQLADADGNPLSGNFTLKATLYNVSTGGTALCSDADPVAVDNGLFNMNIDNCLTSDIDGKQLYLGITVGSDPEMTPRQPIYPVPYAWTLRPGAIISATTSNAIVHIENWGLSGRGLRAYAMSETGTNYGVVGASRSSNGYGGYFYNTAAGDGVKGEGWFGVYGDGTSAGVRGQSESGWGVYGLSTNGDGVGANTLATDHNYGFYTSDNIYSLNYHSSGALMQVVQNDGQTPLETGDVVAFSGIGAPLEEGSPPVIQVMSVDSANSTAVAGVVYSRYNIEKLRAGSEEYITEVTPEGAAGPGEYLLMVVQGPAQVKANAISGSLQPGDLLSSAGQTGYAAKAPRATIDGVESAIPGTVLGKALEPLQAGQALIYIFVTLQ
ncbi:MAG: hypothetical protein ACK2U1_02335 [Anaerolineales bacterium]